MSSPEVPQHLPDLIEVVRDGDTVVILIDGIPLPYFTAPGGWAVNLAVDRKTLPGVTITLLARTVHVHDSIDRKATP
jgi:hypothetical protein